MMNSYPTPYPEVNDVLDRLLIGAQRVLGDQFVGLYLYGSLSSGDFNPHSSDIDFVVITAEELPAEMVAALEKLHSDLAASGLEWAAKLEGCYLPQRDLPRHNPTMAPCPHINEGHFYLAKHGSDWAIQRHILRECGVVIAGPPVAPLIDPVSADDLRQAVRGVLREWWEPQLRESPA
ncbi:MAG: nucleotidyltransferase domain-containing protein, partial [Chloroflexi bacterium]|nr:nucleotidyltransferase domain-containing protein [Chloroflexota bacterium]